MTMARTLKLYRLPEQPQTPGIRAMVAADVPQVRLRPPQSACERWSARPPGCLARLLTRATRTRSCLPPWFTQVTSLLSTYSQRFAVAPEMDEAEVAHWLLPQASRGARSTRHAPRSTPSNSHVCLAATLHQTCALAPTHTP